MMRSNPDIGNHHEVHQLVEPQESGKLGEAKVPVVEDRWPAEPSDWVPKTKFSCKCIPWREWMGSATLFASATVSKHLLRDRSGFSKGSKD